MWGGSEPGTSVETLAPALATVARRLEQAFPAVNAGYTLEMSTPSRLLFMPGPGSGAVTASLALLLMVMPAIVLLVACLNLVDLLLARGQVRRQEMAIRSSLGGGRGRLTRQLITEGLLLALAGGAVGLLLSMWATNALLASLRPVLPVALSLPELDLDWRVLVGTVGFSLAATLLFGAWPAWALTGRAVATDLTRHVRDEGRRAVRRRQDRQCPGDRPGRALAAPARVRWTVPDERALGGTRPIPGFASTGDCSRKSIRVWRGTTKREGDSRISRWWIGCERSRAWKP